MPTIRQQIFALFAAAPIVASPALRGSSADAGSPIEPAMQLSHPSARDQDDLCFWRNEADPAQSLVITSDKKANLIAVYDLGGQLLQTCAVPKPGNIDQRQNVRLGDRELDIIAVNVRDGGKLALFELEHRSRQLKRLDDGTLSTGPNYGLCLYY